jgi:hypothetical protein
MMGDDDVDDDDDVTGVDMGTSTSINLDYIFVSKQHGGGETGFACKSKK